MALCVLALQLRRIELEALRLARLDELQARWLSRAHEIEARGERTRLVRRAAAREREAHREMKLAALEQQQRQHIEELRSKILRKVCLLVAMFALVFYNCRSLANEPLYFDSPLFSGARTENITMPQPRVFSQNFSYKLY